MLLREVFFGLRLLAEEIWVDKTLQLLVPVLKFRDVNPEGSVAVHEAEVVPSGVRRLQRAAVCAEELIPTPGSPRAAAVPALRRNILPHGGIAAQQSPS